MKKSVLIFLFLSRALVSDAQNYRYMLGPELGIAGDIGSIRSAGNFFSKGISFTCKLNNKHLSVRSGLLLDRRYNIVNESGAVQPAMMPYPQNERKSFDYIHLPMQIQISFGTRVKANISAGTYLSRLIGDPTYRNIDVIDSYDRYNAGLISGVGVSTNIERFFISAELRTNIGVLGKGLSGAGINTVEGYLTLQYAWGNISH